MTRKIRASERARGKEREREGRRAGVIILETEARTLILEALRWATGGPSERTLTACVPSACDVIDSLGVWLTRISRGTHECRRCALLAHTHSLSLCLSCLIITLPFSVSIINFLIFSFSLYLSPLIPISQPSHHSEPPLLQ